MKDYSTRFGIEAQRQLKLHFVTLLMSDDDQYKKHIHILQKIQFDREGLNSVHAISNTTCLD